MIISNLEKVITERKRERERARERERVITEKLPITIIFFLKKKVLYVIIAKH